MVTDHMDISSFLTSFIVPLNLSIALLIAGTILFIARHRKTGVLLGVCGIAWVLFWSLPASSLWAGGRLEQLYPHTSPDALPHAQAIVVLGGNTANSRQNWFEPYDPDTATPRVSTAALLYQAKRAPRIVLSGAALDGSLSEAEIMARTLQQQGIPEQALILEADSYTTYENAVYTRRKLDEHSMNHVLLVTSALHMPRAMAVFNKQGIKAIAAPSQPQIVVPDDPTFSFWQPNARALAASRSIIKEYAGLLVYWVRGWI